MTKNERVAVTQADIDMANDYLSSAFRCTATLTERFARHRLAAQPADGWIVGNAKGDRWRTWNRGFSEWTAMRDHATRYARREDAEAVHAEDEDAWRVEPYSPPTEPTQQDSAPVGPAISGGEVVAWRYDRYDGYYLIHAERDHTRLPPWTDEGIWTETPLYAHPTPASPERGDKVERLRAELEETADVLEIILSADPEMPTYQADYDRAEARLLAARAALTPVGEGK